MWQAARLEVTGFKDGGREGERERGRCAGRAREREGDGEVERKGEKERGRWKGERDNFTFNLGPERGALNQPIRALGTFFSLFLGKVTS